jgi:hypothetical protein
LELDSGLSSVAWRIAPGIERLPAFSRDLASRSRAGGGLDHRAERLPALLYQPAKLHRFHRSKIIRARTLMPGINMSISGSSHDIVQ